jgi:hypothetical protein
MKIQGAVSNSNSLNFYSFVKLPDFVLPLGQLNARAKQSYSIAELAITEKQKAFREFVENLKRQGVTGSEYRKKVAEWNREHQ